LSRIDELGGEFMRLSCHANICFAQTRMPIAGWQK